MLAFAIVVIAIIAFSLAQVAKAPTPSDVETATTTPEEATSTEPSTKSVQPKVAYAGPFPVNAADTIASWSFTGGYSGNEALTNQTVADVAKLAGLLGKGEYDDYDLYNGIGNDYNLLGNGKEAYAYYDRAVQIHPEKGLAYLNIGHLMDELGAYYTAADAYAKAVHVEPGMLTYHTERLIFLTRQFPKDAKLVTAALTDASNRFGDNAQILTIEARWLTDLGRYADAITAWKAVKMLSPGKDTTAIDAEIARLEAKQ